MRDRGPLFYDESTIGGWLIVLLVVAPLWGIFGVLAYIAVSCSYGA